MSLEIENLYKKYPNSVVALDDLSISVEKGMFGLLGPNGAGKSSLMRTIATLQLADRGTIFFQDIDVFKDEQSLRKKLGYLPQDFGVYPKISAQNLLDHFAYLKGIISKKDRQKIIDYVLELTNLSDVRKKYVSNFSGGMKQRFGIAQLLLNKPELIIVDEPTAGLDPAERNRFLNVLRQVGTENTVIFSTHIVEDVKDLCTDMAIMNYGKILLHKNPTKAVQNLEDKVWKCTIEEELSDEQLSEHKLLSRGFATNNYNTYRVYAEEAPLPFFEKSTPTLEDVYFLTLESAKKEQQPTLIS